MSQPCPRTAPSVTNALTYSPQNTRDAPSWVRGSIPDGASLSDWPLPAPSPCPPFRVTLRDPHTCCTPQLHSHGRKGKTNTSNLYLMHYFSSHLNDTATKSCRRSSPTEFHFMAPTRSENNSLSSCHIKCFNIQFSVSSLKIYEFSEQPVQYLPFLSIY